MGAIFYPDSAPAAWVEQVNLLLTRLNRDWPVQSYGAPSDVKDASGNLVFLPAGSSEQDLGPLMEAGCKGIIEFDQADTLLSNVPDIGRILASSDPLMVVILTTRTAYQAHLAHILVNALQTREVLSAEKSGDVEMSLHEVLANSLIHGNLELSSALRREAESYADYIAILEKHLADDNMAYRPVLLAARQVKSDFQIIVRDCGKGFDPEDVAPIKWAQASGRGIDIARALTRKISYSLGGRQVQLDYNLQDAEPATQDNVAPKAPAKTEPAATDTESSDTTRGPAPKPAATTSGSAGGSVNKALADAVPVPGAQDVLDARILVIEDTDLNRRIIDGFLRAGGFKNIHMAVDGLEGLEKIKEVDPDIVILDIVMPRMDGFGVLEAVRNDPDYAPWQDLPILVQTALEEPQQRGKVFNVGATDLVSKPIHKLELVSRVKIHLENRNMIRNLVDYQSRTEEELSAAKAMQEGIMPNQDRMQQIRDKYGLTVNAHFETSSELGGDFWGVHDIDDDRLGFFIVDFSGHGVTAALNTFRLHTLMSEVAREINDPAGYMEELNRRLVPLLSISQFCTMIYGVFDMKAKQLSYAGAAAPEPVLVNIPERKAEMLDASGIPMGVIASASYETRTIPFDENSGIFFYSDALTETLLDGKAWEEDGLMEQVNDIIHGIESGHWLDTLLARFFDKATRPLPDDLTVVSFTP